LFVNVAGELIQRQSTEIVPHPHGQTIYREGEG